MPYHTKERSKSEKTESTEKTEEPTKEPTETMEETESETGEPETIESHLSPAPSRSKIVFFSRVASLKELESNPERTKLSISPNAKGMFDEVSNLTSNGYRIDLNIDLNAKKDMEIPKNEKHNVDQIEILDWSNTFPVNMGSNVLGIEGFKPTMFTTNGKPVAMIFPANHSGTGSRKLIEISEEKKSEIPEFKGYTQKTIENGIVKQSIERVHTNKKTGETRKYLEEEMYTPMKHPLFAVMNDWRLDNNLEPLTAEDLTEVGVPLKNTEIAKKLLAGIKTLLGDEVSVKTANIYKVGFEIFPADSYDPEAEVKTPMKTNDKLPAKNFAIRGKSSGTQKEEKKEEEKPVQSMWRKIQTLFVGSNSYMLSQGKEAVDNAMELKHHLWFYARISYH